MKRSLFLCLLLKFARKMFILHFFVATLLQKWHFSMKSTEKSFMGSQFWKIYPPMRHASHSSPPEWIWEKLTLSTNKNTVLKKTVQHKFFNFLTSLGQYHIKLMVLRPCPGLSFPLEQNHSFHENMGRFYVPIKTWAQ